MAGGDLVLKLDLGDLATMPGLMLQLLEKVGTLATQEQADAIMARLDDLKARYATGLSALGTAIDGLRGDIESLKTQAAAASIDLSGVDASLAAVEAQASALNAAVGRRSRWTRRPRPPVNRGHGIANPDFL